MSNIKRENEWNIACQLPDVTRLDIRVIYEKSYRNFYITTLLLITFLLLTNYAFNKTKSE